MQVAPSVSVAVWTSPCLAKHITEGVDRRRFSLRGRSDIFVRSEFVSGEQFNKKQQSTRGQSPHAKCTNGMEGSLRWFLRLQLEYLNPGYFRCSCLLVSRSVPDRKTCTTYNTMEVANSAIAPLLNLLCYVDTILAQKFQFVRLVGIPASL